MRRTRGSRLSVVVCRAACVILAALISACSPALPTPPSPPTPPPVTGFLQAPPAAPASLDPLVGRYELDITVADSSCAPVPAHAQRRKYTADIHGHEGRYAVKLYDAAFLSDGNAVRYGCGDGRLPYDGACHMFLMQRDDHSTVSMTMSAEDEWRGSEIWERLADGRLLSITGDATGFVRDGRIEAAGSGGLWLGNGLPASVVHACRGDLQLTFSRR